MTSPVDTKESAALPAAPDLAAAAAGWLVPLARERRLSARTIEAYGRDARQFLAFLAERFGAPPGIADFTDLAPGDLRAFLAHRRGGGGGGRPRAAAVPGPTAPPPPYRARDGTDGGRARRDPGAQGRTAPAPPL